MSITPWITHDQMVIQMFGITDQCVHVRPDEVEMGRGLVNGTFRIEYKNATGTVAVEGKDFGLTNDLSKPVTNGMGVDDGLLEDKVAICRTPHYLTVCTDDVENAAQFTGGSCPSYCEYWPDFKSDDATIPVNKHHNATMSCDKHDVNTFDGSNLVDDPTTVVDVEGPRVKALVFEDKCDADSFVMVDGQIINIQGDLTGPLEVEVVDKGAAYPETTDVVFEFYLNPKGEDPWLVFPVTKADLTAIAAATEHADQWRFHVYSKHGIASVCYLGCESSAALRVCHTIEPELDGTNVNDVATDNDLFVGDASTFG